MSNIIKIKKSSNGILSPKTAVTVKNQINGIRSLEDIPDVAEINVEDGSTVVYNATTDKYEIKQMDLDGGEF